MSDTNTASGGIGILGVLQVIFITLKLCKAITWSWWLVLIPLWIELGIVAVILVILAIVGIFAFVSTRR